MGLFDFLKKPRSAAAPTRAPVVHLSVIRRAGSPGDLTDLAGLALPRGRLIASEERPHEPLAWISEPGDHLATWQRLVEAFPLTGLWPVVAEGLTHDADRPWLSGEFDGPAAPIGDAEGVLKQALANYASDDDEDEYEDDYEDEGDADQHEDDGWRSRWEGLASGAAVGDAVTIAAPDAVERLLLVPVTRPADVPAQLGWWGTTNYDLSGADVSAVLRSWEDRFGAVLIEMSFDTLTVHAAHPPVEPRQIELLAREQFAFCPDIVDQGVETLEALQEIVADARWWFWWD